VLGGGTVLVAACLTCCRPPDQSSPDPTPEPAGPAWFEDATDRFGIDFTHDPGPVPGNYLLPQINGSGCAVADLDGDGRPDLLFLTAGGPAAASRNKLYRQRPDHTFEDVSAGSGLDFAAHSLGVAVGDVDNDGRPDVVITQFGGVRLFRNLGGMTFRDVTEESGVWTRGWATSASFLDYDRDGKLDLVVVHGVDVDPSWKCTNPDGELGYCSPNVFPGAATRLFHNESAGDRVQFKDVTVVSGLGTRPGPGLGIVCADFDGDGWTDIFVSNDARPNHLWVNKHDGTFAEEAPTRGVAYNGMGKAWAGMGVALGDVNGDGMADILVSHLGIETNTLWVQSSRGLYADRTAGSGLAAGGWRGTGWGITLSDFNHDGRLDSVVVNGRVQRGPSANPDLGPYWSRYAERNQFFVGIGKGTFRDRSSDEPALCGSPNNARGLAVGDLDGDGALDLVLTTIGNRARVFRNVCPDRGHWALVRCIDPARGGRDAHAAKVVLITAGVRRVGYADPGGSFLSSSDPRAHFGLGPNGVVDVIEVSWSDGSREEFTGGPADRVFVLRKGSGKQVGQ
ncbi:MAG TPA: CRTAC1 family protein, partial [Urbifossiella sp.]|nr:CRTAC1 family protein [Urbifossiella sp.]